MKTAFIIASELHESEKALPVLVPTKGITAEHENWIERHSRQDSYLIHVFYSQLLRCN